MLSSALIHPKKVFPVVSTVIRVHHDYFHSFPLRVSFQGRLFPESFFSPPPGLRFPRRVYLSFPFPDPFLRVFFRRSRGVKKRSFSQERILPTQDDRVFRRFFLKKLTTGPLQLYDFRIDRRSHGLSSSLFPFGFNFPPPPFLSEETVGPSLPTSPQA